MAIDEPIEIVEHDPGWARWFERESNRLRSAGLLKRCSIEHVGSTAVPALPAKPIVDIMLGMESFPPPPPLVSELASLGYEHLGEAGVQGRLYFRRRGRRSFNLHLVQLGSDHWRNALALRDYLIAHPAERSRYVEAKRRAVADGRTTLLAYSEAKAAVLSDLIVRARVWGGSR